jgi:hypothetical protein
MTSQILAHPCCGHYLFGSKTVKLTHDVLIMKKTEGNSKPKKSSHSSLIIDKKIATEIIPV